MGEGFTKIPAAAVGEPGRIEPHDSVQIAAASDGLPCDYRHRVRIITARPWRDLVGAHSGVQVMEAAVQDPKPAMRFHLSDPCLPRCCHWCTVSPLLGSF